jgi:hypothetical protein
VNFAFRLRRMPRPRPAPTRTAASPIRPAGISSVPLIALLRLVDERTRKIANITRTFKRERKDFSRAPLFPDRGPPRCEAARNKNYDRLEHDPPRLKRRCRPPPSRCAALPPPCPRGRVGEGAGTAIQFDPTNRFPELRRRGHATRLARHSPVPNWLRFTMPAFWSLAAPNSTVPDIAPSATRPSKWNEMLLAS